MIRDICSCVDCNRHADRDLAGRPVCDECYLSDKPLYFGWPPTSLKRSFWETHPRIAAIALFLFFIYIVGGAVAGLVAMWPHVKCDSFPSCLLD